MICQFDIQIPMQTEHANKREEGECRHDVILYGQAHADGHLECCVETTSASSWLCCRRMLGAERRPGGRRASARRAAEAQILSDALLEARGALLITPFAWHAWVRAKDQLEPRANSQLRAGFTAGECLAHNGNQAHRSQLDAWRVLLNAFTSARVGACKGRSRAQS